MFDVVDTSTNLYVNKVNHDVMLLELEKLPEGQVAFLTVLSANFYS